MRAVEPRLRQALSATLGSDLGRDAAVDALSYGWEHWERIRSMDNPAGYLFVVGRSHGRRRDRRRRRVVLMPVDPDRTPWVEPELPSALARLPEQQRIAVTLVHAFHWTISEVAELLGTSRSTVQTHSERGLAKLRTLMGVTL